MSPSKTGSQGLGMAPTGRGQGRGCLARGAHTQSARLSTVPFCSLSVKLLRCLFFIKPRGCFLCDTGERAWGSDSLAGLWQRPCRRQRGEPDGEAAGLALPGAARERGGDLCARPAATEVRSGRSLAVPCACGVCRLPAEQSLPQLGSYLHRQQCLPCSHPSCSAHHAERR